MIELINRRKNHVVDHIALGTCDTLAGVEYIRELTGVEPHIFDKYENSWYWSAKVGLGERSFLEIIGPNPDYKKFNPKREMLLGLKEPQLLFWFLGTNQFEECRRLIKEAGYVAEGYTHAVGEMDGESINYETILLGKGFASERPCLIQWNETPTTYDGEQCELKSLEIESPEADKLNRLFKLYGIYDENLPGQHVKKGAARLTLTLDSPKGVVVLQGGGVTIPSGVKVLGVVIPMVASYLKRRVGSRS